MKLPLYTENTSRRFIVYSTDMQGSYLEVLILIAATLALSVTSSPCYAQQSEAARRADIEQQIRSQMSGVNMSDAQLKSMVDEILEQSNRAVKANKDASETKPKPSDADSRDVKTVGKVKVSGQADRDVTKTYIGKDQLDDPASQSVLDVLRRQPGLQVTGSSVSIMGMPGRYTQILVDGRRPPPTFNLQNLKPADVDYIEVMFGAEADKPSEGIAGSINVVLKRRVVKRNPVAQVTVDGGSLSGIGLFGSLNSVGTNGNSFTANASASTSIQSNSSSSVTIADTRMHGQERKQVDSSTSATTYQQNAWLRWNRTLPDSSFLALSLTANRMDLAFLNSFHYSVNLSDSPMLSSLYSRSKTSSATPSVRWSKTLNSKWTTELFVTSGASERRWNSFTDFEGENLRTNSLGVVKDVRTSADAKLNYRYRKGAELEFGIAGERTEWRSKDQKDVGSLSIQTLQDLSTQASRSDQALYVKWVRSFGENLGINTGLRWTHWRIAPPDVAGGAIADRFDDYGLAPSVNLTYRSERSGRWSLNAARSFSPPTFTQLGTSSLSGIAELNRPLEAWSIGNANLRKEVSDIAMLSWEKKLTPRFDTTWRISARRVQDSIGYIITQNLQSNLWIMQPINLPDARIRTLTASGKYIYPLSGTARSFTLGATVVRNWTRIQGLDSRFGLQDQLPFSSTLTFDWQLDDVTMGLDLGYQRESDAYNGPGFVTRKASGFSGNGRISWKATPNLTVSANMYGLIARDLNIEREYQQGDEMMVIRDLSTAAPFVSMTARYQF